jgi:hypothetical protein
MCCTIRIACMHCMLDCVCTICNTPPVVSRTTCDGVYVHPECVIHPESGYHVVYHLGIWRPCPGVHTRNVISPPHHARGACTGMVYMCYTYAPCIAYMQCSGAYQWMHTSRMLSMDIHRYGIPYPRVWVYHLM